MRGQEQRLATLEKDLAALFEAKEALGHAYQSSTWGRAHLALHVSGVNGVLKEIALRRETLKAAVYDVSQGKEPRA